MNFLIRFFLVMAERFRWRARYDLDIARFTPSLTTHNGIKRPASSRPIEAGGATEESDWLVEELASPRKFAFSELPIIFGGESSESGVSGGKIA
jgi:hypothetical protein